MHYFMTRTPLLKASTQKALAQLSKMQQPHLIPEEFGVHLRHGTHQDVNSNYL
jgi:hypothetical protein